MFVFFLTGIWHGSNYTYILWGLYHGIIVVIERLLGKKEDSIKFEKKKLRKEKRKKYREEKKGKTEKKEPQENKETKPKRGYIGRKHYRRYKKK